MYSTSTTTFLVLISQQQRQQMQLMARRCVQLHCAPARCAQSLTSLGAGGEEVLLKDRERLQKHVCSVKSKNDILFKEPFSGEGQYSRFDILHSWPRDTFSASKFLFSIVAKATLLCSKSIKSKCKIKIFGVDFLHKSKTGDCCVIYLLSRLSGCWFEVVVMEM